MKQRGGKSNITVARYIGDRPNLRVEADNYERERFD